MRHLKQAHKKSPTTIGVGLKYTIKGEINETKPTILYDIYLHLFRLHILTKVPAVVKKVLRFCDFGMIPKCSHNLLIFLKINHFKILDTGIRDVLAV